MDSEAISISSSSSFAEDSDSDVEPTSIKQPCRGKGKNSGDYCGDKFDNSCCSPISSGNSSPFQGFKRVSKVSPKKDTVVMNEKPKGRGSEEETKDKNSTTGYASKLNIICKNARFFLIKSNIEENVTMSKSLGAWSTFAKNEYRLNKAFKTTPNVLVIFSVTGSSKFCGFARLASGSENQGDKCKINWTLPSHAHVGGVFRLDWISKETLDFSKTRHLYNPWNFGKPVKIGRDGQEIDGSIGLKLCRLFKEDANVDWAGTLKKAKEALEIIKCSEITKPISTHGFVAGFGGKRDDRSQVRNSKNMGVHSYSLSSTGDNVNKRPRQHNTYNKYYYSENHSKRHRLTYYGNYYEYPHQQNNYYFYGPPTPMVLPRYYDGPPMPSNSSVLLGQNHRNRRY